MNIDEIMFKVQTQNYLSQEDKDFVIEYVKGQLDMMDHFGDEHCNIDKLDQIKRQLPEEFDRGLFLSFGL